MTLAGRVVEFQPNLGFEQLSLLASPPSCELLADLTSNLDLLSRNLYSFLEGCSLFQPVDNVLGNIYTWNTAIDKLSVFGRFEQKIPAKIGLSLPAAILSINFSKRSKSVNQLVWKTGPSL